MRPKLLRIEGLQSFQDSQEIDFDALGQTGLFGIFGPTGSGKSTVLDAITFALYGKVKRAERGTQGIINTNREKASVAFSFELLKEGSRRTYRVERIYQRKKGSDNSCEAKIARLIEISQVGEIPLCDKATDVTSCVEELLGLSHDDFTRAVVLPQNSFQEFLFLDNRKKREMLERIFYLEEYGRELNDKLFRQLDGLKSRIERLSGELSAYADASDQALEEAKQLLTAALQEQKTAENQLQSVTIQYDEAREVWQLVQEIAEIQRLGDAQLAFQQSMEDGRVRLDKGRRAEGLAEMISKIGLLSEKLAATTAAEERIAAQLPMATDQLNALRLQQERLQAESAAAMPKLLAWRTRLLDGLPLKTAIGQMDDRLGVIAQAAALLEENILHTTGQLAAETQIVFRLGEKSDQLKADITALHIDPDYRRDIQAGRQLEIDQAALADRLAGLHKKAAALQVVISAQERDLAEKRRTIAGFADQLQILNGEMEQQTAKKPVERQFVLAAREECYQLQASYSLLKQKDADIALISGNVARFIAHSQAEEKTIAVLVEERQLAADQVEQQKRALELAVQEMAAQSTYLLAKNLQEGIPCPVCGSDHHPHPAHQAAGEGDWAKREKQLAEAENQLRAAEQSLKAAETNCLVKTEQHKSTAEQIRLGQLEIGLKTEEFQSLRQKLPADLLGLSLPDLSSVLAERNQQHQENLLAYDAWEEEDHRLQREIGQINRPMADERAAENGILSALQVNRQHINLLEGELAEARQSQKHCQDQYQAFLADKKISGAAAELGRLADDDRQIILRQKQLGEVEGQLVHKRQEQDLLQTEMGRLTSEQVKLTAEGVHLGRERNESAAKLRQLAGEADIEAQIQSIDHQLAAFTAQAKQLQDQLAIQAKEQQELLTAGRTLANQKEIYREDLGREEANLQAGMLARGFADRREVEASLLGKEEQQRLAAEIEAYDQKVSTINSQREMVASKLGGRRIDLGSWLQIEADQKKKAAAKEAAVSGTEVARNNCQLIQAKHDKWLILNREFLALSHEQNLLAQIQTLLKGERGKDNSFIDYIAEERLRYVAAKASETLGLMTRFKYALELDADAGFIIRDNGNGGVHRMVSSLSGGETFLTSLSLALALSEQIQLKGQSPLEFFFLDEGFGTLDNTLLDAVIDALERLSTQTRVIGIISHVPELRSRIGRRLIIEPPTLQGEGSQVRIEKA